jgi:ATP-dependent Lon protease
MELDALDRKASDAFDGFIVRKDLVRQFSRQFPVPTYVVEFMLGRYCATTNEQEIQEGLSIVQRQLSERTVRAGNEALIHSIAKEKGQVKIIDIISARLDAKTDSYVAELPSLKLRDVRIKAELVTEHERMLTGGFYAESDPGLRRVDRPGKRWAAVRRRWPARDSALQAQTCSMTCCRRTAKLTTVKSGRTFCCEALAWNPSALTPRARDMILLRMVPFVERNYNMVEIGSARHRQEPPVPASFALCPPVSGGKATVARMFVNNANGQRGLVCQYDVVCFDEVSGVSFDQKDGVNIMKGYMESGEFSRGKESIRADGGNRHGRQLRCRCQHQQRIGHLFGRCRRKCATTPPSWTAFTATCQAGTCRSSSREIFTEHFGLVSDFCRVLHPPARTRAA